MARPSARPAGPAVLVSDRRCIRSVHRTLLAWGLVLLSPVIAVTIPAGPGAFVEAQSQPAQNPLGNPDFTAPMTVTLPILRLVPSEVAQGGIARLPLAFTTTQPVPVLFVGCFVVPEQLHILTFEEGPGLASYIAAQEDPPDCDIIIYPNNNGASLFIYMNPPYEPSQHGIDFMRVKVQAQDYLGDSIVTVLDQGQGVVDLVSVPVVEQPLLRRGDLDDDGHVTLTDVVRLLTYVVGQGDLACPIAGDCDADGQLDLTDALQLVQGLFLGSPPLPDGCEGAPDIDPDDCQQTSCES